MQYYGSAEGDAERERLRRTDAELAAVGGNVTAWWELSREQRDRSFLSVDTAMTQLPKNSPNNPRRTVVDPHRCLRPHGRRSAAVSATTTRPQRTPKDGNERVESTSQAEYAGSIPVIGSM